MKKSRLVAFVLCILFTSCGVKDVKPKAKRIGIPIYVEVLELDPIRVADHGTSQILGMLYEGLMTHNEHGDLDFGVASSFEIDKSGTRYLFKLRDCRWSNGDKVTAFDFEYAWINALNPEKPSKSGRSLYTIKNARAYVRKEVGREEVGIKVIDDTTLQITLEQPSPFFIEQLSTIPYMPVYKKRAMAVPGWATLLSREYVSNGPFVIDSFQRSVGLQVKKNPLYWDAQAVHLDRIEVAYVPDNLTQAYLFKNGKLDWLGLPFTAFDYEAFDSLSITHEVQHKEVLGAFWLQMNTTREILSNKNIRKAISCAINREEIAKYVLRSEVIPAFRFLPRGFYVDQKTTLSADVLQAKEYLAKGLAELGLKKEDIPPLSLSYVLLGSNKSIAEVIQSQLKSRLDLSIDLKQTEWKVHLDNVARGNFDIGQIAWFASYRDPMYFFKMFSRKESTANYSRWENARYKELLILAETTTSDTVRSQIFEEMEQIILDELPVVPIYFSCNPFITSKTLKGVQLNDLGLTSFKYARVLSDTEQ